MSQRQKEEFSTGVSFEPPNEPLTWRTPGRKLTKEDLSATSALILGCTCQCCPDARECSSASGPETG
jgi:hypothetical protein